MSPAVKVFGRRDDVTIRALLWPASEKRQGTKSRDAVPRARYGDLATGSGSHVKTRSGSEISLASLAERKLKHDPAAGVLSDEILCLLNVNAQGAYRADGNDLRGDHPRGRRSGRIRRSSIRS
jgi:hypothetical protein